MAEQDKVIEDVQSYSLEDLKKKAEDAGVSKSGTKQEIADRINEQSTAQGAEGKDASGTKGVDSGNEGEPKDEPQPRDGGAEAAYDETGSPATGGGAGESGVENYPAAAGPTDPDRKAGEDDLPVAVAGSQASKDAEIKGKEDSVPGSDPRDSVSDVAPGKSLDEVIEKRNAHLRGEYQDKVHPRGAWFYTVKEGQASLMDVALDIGFSDVSLLSVANGRYNGQYAVAPGDTVRLPDGYTFDGVDGAEEVVPTEEDGAPVAPRIALEEYDNRTNGERLLPPEELEKLRS
jgi:hypothetical protein